MKKDKYISFFLIFIVVLYFIFLGFSEIAIFGDILVILIPVVLIPYLKKTKYISTPVISKKLKYFYSSIFYLLLTVVIIGIISRFLGTSSGVDKLINTMIRGEKIIKIPDYIDSSPVIVITRFVFSAFLAFLLVLILLEIHQLILIKSRKFIRKAFNFLLILIFLYILVNLDSPILTPDFDNQFSFSFQTVTHGILFGLILLIMLILSFKSSWVNFISKKEKILSLLAGISILFIVAFIDIFTVSEMSVIHASVIRFYMAVKNFVSIYVIMSIFSILLHLPTAGLIDKRMKQFNTFSRLSESIPILKLDQVTNLVTWMACEVSDGRKSWLLLWNEENNKFHVASSYNLLNTDYELVDTSENFNLNKRIISSKDVLIINEIDNDREINLKTRLRGSLIGIPIISDEDIYGILYVLKDEAFGFDWEDSDMLKSLGNQTLIAIKNTNLLEESLEKERLKQEMKVARQVQLGLLPEKIPDFGEKMRIDAVSIPANTVGGDYYDFCRINDNKVGVIIGDVSGKGISAAFYMAAVKGIIKSFLSITCSPVELLKKVNQILYENSDRKTFVTLVFGIFDLKDKTFHFARAGHTPILHYDKKKQKGTYLQPGGLGLGLDRGKIFDKNIVEDSIKLNKGDVVFLYTDGITEALDKSGNEFGEDRLLNLVLEFNELNPEEIKSKVLNDFEDFSKGGKKLDDITLIIAKYF